MRYAEEDKLRTIYPAGRLVSALGVFLFGGLICFIDINIKSETMILDVVPDVIGYTMIVGALTVLSRVRIDAAFSAQVGFAWVVAFLCVLHSLAAIRMVNPGPVWNVVTWGLGVAQAFAGMAFCGAMMTLAHAAGAERSYTSFRSARALIGLFIAGPLLVSFLWVLSTGRVRTSYELGSDVGWFVVLIVAIGLLVMLQFFLSVRWLQRDFAALARFSD